MKYFYVEAYNDDGDYEYLIFTENKEDIEEKIKEEREEDILTVTIHNVYGPFEVTEDDIIKIKQP